MLYTCVCVCLYACVCMYVCMAEWLERQRSDLAIPGSNPTKVNLSGIRILD